MPLTFNLRHIETKVLHLTGECPAGDFDANDVDELVRISQPLSYDLWVEKLKQSVLVRGQLRFSLDCQCARCLRPFKKRVELSEWSCDLPLEGEERVPIEHDCVDLTPFIREDILLAFPQHPLCKTECSGLPIASQNHQKTNETKAGVISPAWDELNKLKF